ncbi:MAG TPA: M15 family metallopeptidase [Candidatus Paceibacterota bacterium]|nr:M15 family metallopeptidase [Candidatus Paceibacterota bacterium]HMO82788.1 M15 family metallopeptidase [Candidatus Paceibacterota bacterium]
MESSGSKLRLITIIIMVLLVGLASYLVVQNRLQTVKINMLLEERNFFLLETASSTKTYLREQEQASSTIATLTQQLAFVTEELEVLASDYRKEKDKNDDFEDQIRAISGTVGVLDKLSKTDKELLQKYSKTYFLNENFIPMKLREINSRYILPGKKDQYFHGDAIKFLTNMLDDAKEDGHDIKIISAYRSFDEQVQLKGQFSQTYGSGANTFSADQGYSEHQLGTAVDIVDVATGATSQSFAQTKAYKWLMDNAYKYGFILSYPEGNNFYIFEPWHWRFVGRDLARDLHRQKATFYEWDQRKIDEYLISIFD